MFTGLVQELGRVLDIKKEGESMKLTIESREAVKDAKKGDSISTNGVCLTAVEVGGNTFTADVMPESFNRANLKRLKKGDLVNLEKSITLSTPLGGHLVTGDVDCEGEIISIKNDGIAIIYEVKCDEKYMKYVVEKGRITIDGASLTVVSFTKNTLKVSLIPHTQKNITLGYKKESDIVNLEFDLIGKYVEKLLTGYLGENQAKKSTVDLKFLIENGFA